ncbi:hypothetical protein LTR85_012037 [Meristemomyces frigidus]|nr:hypothetical protein LTR85_012037 [Meristemomyces frigidus]
MAPPKERAKSSRMTNKPTIRKADTVSNKKRANRVTERSKTRTNATHRKDLFMTLPGELRNEVYSCVLIEANPVLVGTVNGLCKDPNHPTANERDGKKSLDVWREPALLQVSKAIRAEGSTLYYGSNQFAARARLVDFARLGAWLKQLTVRCGPKLFQTFTISVLSAAWSELHHAKTLAKILYKTKLEVEPGTMGFRRGHGFGYAYRADEYRIRAPLNAALALGQQAARERWSRGKLDRRLKIWLDQAYTPNWINKILKNAGNDYWGELAAELALSKKRPKKRSKMASGGAVHAEEADEEAAGGEEGRDWTVKVEEVADAN